MSQQHTSHPQPHEQLLMGWIAGGITLMRDEREREMKQDDETMRGAKGDETTGEGHETMGGR
jgi:hypothetical protein